MANERGVCFDNKNIFWLLASQKQELLMQIQNISSFLFAENASVSSIRQEETAAFVSRFRQSDFPGLNLRNLSILRYTAAYYSGVQAS